MQRTITHVPNQILRTVSSETIVDRKTVEIIKDLRDTLLAQDNPKGVGLSAPQIGKNIRVFITLLAENDDEEPTPKDIKIFINPVIHETSKEFTFGPDPDDPILEGCLSIPKLYGPVPRHSWVKTSYETIDLKTPTEIKKVEARFKDFFARVIQHEQDHLNGVLFLDHSFKHDLPIYEQKGKSMIKANRDIVKSLL